MKNSKAKTAFQAAYLSIPRVNKQHVKTRNEIVRACNTGTHVFYFWLNGTTPVPFLAKPVISKIMNIPQDELFPEPEFENKEA